MKRARRGPLACRTKSEVVKPDQALRVCMH